MLAEEPLSRTQSMVNSTEKLASVQQPRNEMSTTAAVHHATHLTGIAPQFLVDDLDQAIAYYCHKLGFELDFKYQSFYAGVTRDGFAIHLKHAPKLTAEREHRKRNEHLDAYISVSGIRGLFSELEMRGAQVIKPLEERPWACLDFYVEDPDGYMLCFSEPNA
jgi:catechol 2,3-dioxygenase-like lactoylglutathione lyase family enzyme